MRNILKKGVNHSTTLNYVPPTTLSTQNITFKITYCKKQKQKKYLDGTLNWNPNCQKGSLIADHGVNLETKFFKNQSNPQQGDEFEFDGYEVIIEETETTSQDIIKVKKDPIKTQPAPTGIKKSKRTKTTKSSKLNKDFKLPNSIIPQNIENDEFKGKKEIFYGNVNSNRNNTDLEKINQISYGNIGPSYKEQLEDLEKSEINPFQTFLEEIKTSQEENQTKRKIHDPDSVFDTNGEEFLESMEEIESDDIPWYDRDENDFRNSDNNNKFDDFDFNAIDDTNENSLPVKFSNNSERSFASVPVRKRSSKTTTKKIQDPNRQSNNSTSNNSTNYSNSDSPPSSLDNNPNFSNNNSIMAYHSPNTQNLSNAQKPFQKNQNLSQKNPTQLSSIQKKLPSNNLNQNEFKKAKMEESRDLTFSQLNFLSEKEIDNLNGRLPQRTKTIPLTFPSVLSYKNTWKEALYEEMNLQLIDFNMKFRSICCSLPGRDRGGPKCSHGPLKLLTAGETSKNPGRQYYKCPKFTGGCKIFHWKDEWTKNNSNNSQSQKISALQPLQLNQFNCQKIRASGIKIYTQCELIYSSGDRSIATFLKNNNNNNFKNSENLDKPRGLYLKLSDEYKEHSSSYMKDDLWIISSDPNFGLKGNILFVKSISHGPAKSGLLEVAPIEDQKISNHKTGLYALHGPNWSSELNMLDNLFELTMKSLPIIPYFMQGITPSPNVMEKHKLLGNSENKTPVSFSKIDRDLAILLRDEILSEYLLNEDQTVVLNQCLEWFYTDKEPITLVHGPFGSGKSFLLAVIIIFLDRLLQEDENLKLRILVCSSTNTAVDRVLLGLMSHGFTNIGRVGSLKKIAKPLLPFTVQASEDKEALKDLKEMLKDISLSISDRENIEESIKMIKKGDLQSRTERLKTTRVIGVTCAASMFHILDNNEFPLVFLDECSQMLEPSSLIPLNRFKCQRLLGVGDPLQLPPVNSFGGSDGFGKTFFVRLAEIGFEPQLLRTQYRCHPQLSELANKLFYENRLLDGISGNDRLPLIRGLPALVHVDNPSGIEVQDRKSGSWYNDQEANLIVKIISILLDHKVDLADIGVITLYKAQAKKISELLVQQGISKKPVAKKKTSKKPQFSDNEEEEDEEEENSELQKTKNFQVSTVDAFQGAEKEIIILATTRTNRLGDFTNSPTRLNVAITRARCHLILVGNRKLFEKEKLWTIILDSAKSKKNGQQTSESILQSGSFSIQ